MTEIFFVITTTWTEGNTNHTRTCTGLVKFTPDPSDQYNAVMAEVAEMTGVHITRLGILLYELTPR